MCSAECDTADVGPNIVCDDEAGRQEEPDHAFEDVVHYEVGLDNNEVKSHVGPGELGKLESVMAFFKTRDEKDEPYNDDGLALVTSAVLLEGGFTYNI